MSDDENNIINLNQFRKKKKRSEKESLATQNRAKFGRTKAEKHQDEKDADDLERHVNNHKREDD